MCRFFEVRSHSRRTFRLELQVFLLGFCLSLFAAPGFSQDSTPRYSPPGLADLPMIFETSESPVLVEAIATGLSHPWGMVFLPGGDMLITERGGRVRLLRDGLLEAEPVSGTPEVFVRGLWGLMDIALHPGYADNQLVYLTYNKPTEKRMTVALSRGRFDGGAFRDMRDIFVAAPDTSGGSRILFAPDGSLYMTVGGAFTPGVTAERAQAGDWHSGKVLRLNDDGSPHAENPFVGTEGFHPEIWSMGHRNQQGLAINPATGELWAHEHAMQGGDELNIIRRGGNYGWPEVSFARLYNGPRIHQQPWREGLLMPETFWVPSIAPSGLLFYTGDRFPAWQGHIFVGAMRVGRVRGTGHLERIVLNENDEETAREWILEELGERIRDVRQGPDGLIYLLTEADEAALLRLSPAEPE